MKLDKEEIFKMNNLILDQYILSSARIEYTNNEQTMIITGLIKAINVIIRNYSKSEEDAKEIVNSVRERIKDFWERAGYDRALRDCGVLR